jgi:DNA-binding NarL/FixJ family response regulator
MTMSRISRAGFSWDSGSRFEWDCADDMHKEPKGRSIRRQREVHNGGHPIPPLIASRMAERIGRNQGALSPREIEVLELITKGKRNKEIVGRQPGDRAHPLKHIFAKLGVSDRTSAVTAALSRRIVHIP